MSVLLDVDFTGEDFRAAKERNAPAVAACRPRTPSTYARWCRRRSDAGCSTTGAKA